LLFGNNNKIIYLTLEKYDGETQEYTRKTESGEYLLERIKIKNPSGEYEYAPGEIPDEYNASFKRYLTEYSQVSEF